MFKYTACGLNISSEIKIPFLKSSEFKRSDIAIKLKDLSYNPIENIELKNDGEIYYKDSLQNIFLIKPNANIQISVDQSDSFEIANSLVGVPLGFAFQKKGFQVLHGSVVTKRNKAFCFIGKSGSGKSSLAAFLVDYGYKIISEDLCIIKESYVFNFSNWVKLNQDSYTDNIDFIRKENLKRDNRKRSYFLLPEESVCLEKKKVKSIYFLQNSKDISISKLSNNEIFKNLLTYSYRSSAKDVQNLNNLTKIMNSINCYEFSRNFQKPLNENLRYLLDYLN